MSDPSPPLKRLRWCFYFALLVIAWNGALIGIDQYYHHHWHQIEMQESAADQANPDGIHRSLRQRAVEKQFDLEFQQLRELMTLILLVPIALSSRPRRGDVDHGTI